MALSARHVPPAVDDRQRCRHQLKQKKRRNKNRAGEIRSKSNRRETDTLSGREDTAENYSRTVIIDHNGQQHSISHPSIKRFGAGRLQ